MVLFKITSDKNSRQAVTRSTFRQPYKRFEKSYLAIKSKWQSKSGRVTKSQLMRMLVVQYAIYSTRGEFSCLKKHLASPRALSATRPLLSCCKSRTALRARITCNYYEKYDIGRSILPHSESSYLALEENILQ